MYEDAFSHLIPPVQNIAIFFVCLSVSENFCLLTHSGNCLKFLVFGLIALLNEPIEHS